VEGLLEVMSLEVATESQGWYTFKELEGVNSKF